jgi:hypothetical protein
MWHDLQTTELYIQMMDSEKSKNGFKMFLIAHNFLRAYPKNAQLLATSFGVCEWQVQGKNLWRWVRRLATLKGIKIVWTEDEYNNPESQTFIILVDGTDSKVWERKHATMTVDKDQYSYKFNHGGLKYEIAIDVNRAQVVWISGPHRGGMHNKTVYVEKGL